MRENFARFLFAQFDVAKSSVDCLTSRRLDFSLSDRFARGCRDFARASQKKVPAGKRKDRMRIGHFSARLFPQWSLLFCGLSLALCAIAQSASADVLDIGADGAVTLYDQPGIFRDGTFTALAHPRSSRAAGIPELLSSAARRYGLDPELLSRIAWAESRYQAGARSAKGAVGVMQLMDGTARDLGVDRHDPSENILGGAAYLRQMLDRYGGNVGLAVAAYNAGPGAVDRYGGVPPFPETRAYLQAVLGPGRVAPASNR